MFFFLAVSNYTREAGVRSLERKIGGVCRAVAVRVRTCFGLNLICHYFTCFVSSGKTGLPFQSTRTPILRGLKMCVTFASQPEFWSCLVNGKRPICGIPKEPLFKSRFFLLPG